jgi:hypothetical protein
MKEDGRWVSSGRSEKSVIVREDLMSGLFPSYAQFRYLAAFIHFAATCNS